MQSPRERIEDFKEMAANSLVLHEITKVVQTSDNTTMWVIKSPGTSKHWAQIIVTFDHSLIVHGDTTDVTCFSRYFGGENAMARDVVAWIADKDIQGVTEKAIIGTGRAACREFDEGVAIYEALDFAETYGEDNPDLKKILTKAARRFEDDDPDEVKHWIYEETGDAELANLGDVPSSQVIWSWLLVRNLNELLRHGIPKHDEKG